MTNIISNTFDNIPNFNNSTESEAELEQRFLSKLQSQGYELVNKSVFDQETLLLNLKNQLFLHNKSILENIPFTEKEFDIILSYLNSGDIIDKSIKLRGSFNFKREHNNKEVTINFLNTNKWCNNIFQVTNQITINGKFVNRYDVTILINGLPLVQIELKKRGVGLNEAFNQINRYKKNSFNINQSLFQFTQILIVSNGVNTKYYANNPITKSTTAERLHSFEQTFFWADKNNKIISKLLPDFSDTFLEPCFLSKIISNYIVITSDRSLMILRPYQCYATEAVINLVDKNLGNGYVWHTTGSGKTLTSFKTSQLLSKLSSVDKILFVVDRNDLDHQTVLEFNKFSEGSVDQSKNTAALAKQLNEPGRKLIVTTIQKLNNVISEDKKYSKELSFVKNKKFVFLFDECHRSQFGETHKKIKKFFPNHQLIGYTGTPILAENATSEKQTTANLFQKELHKYIIKDAINDNNVLKFNIEYVGRYSQKESKTELDIRVDKDINVKEVLNDKDRFDKITNFIIKNHSHKTNSKKFNSLFATSSQEAAMSYYNLFKTKKENGEHNLKFAVVFSYGQNQEEKSLEGFGLGEEIVSENAREFLENAIQDYNKEFGTNFSTKEKDGYNFYYKDLTKRLKNKEKREIDIVIVVNMLLTGFDSKFINTLYVDKNLNYHGLIQAFSRTNRIYDKNKTMGNIVCFRNLKKDVDDAIALFSDENAQKIVITGSMEEYLTEINKNIEHLFEIAKTPEDVDNLIGENAKFEFIKTFREILRDKNNLSNFFDYNKNLLTIDEQTLNDYQSKYLDLNQEIKKDRNNGDNKISILNDIDFETELIGKDIINVDYIINLLQNYFSNGEKSQVEKEKNKKKILNEVNSNLQLRYLKDLIENFIEENDGTIFEKGELQEKFLELKNKEEQNFKKMIIEKYGISKKELNKIINSYIENDKKITQIDFFEKVENKNNFFIENGFSLEELNKLKHNDFSKYIEINEKIENKIYQYFINDLGEFKNIFFSE